MIDIEGLITYQKKVVEADTDLNRPAYIYFLFEKGVLLYIGKAVDFESRIEHHRSSKFFDEAKYVQVPYLEYGEREKEFIKKYAPILNVQHVPKGSAMFAFVGDDIFYERGNSYPYRFLDGVIYRNDSACGYYNDDKIEFNPLTFRAIHYDRNTHKYSIEKLNNGRSFIFDHAQFRYVENKIEIKKEENLYRIVSIPENYRFKKGKYEGRLLSEIYLENKGYVNWFISHPMFDKWIKH